MNPFWIILLLVLLLIYIISPIDVIPDMFPLLGWLDDTFLLGLLIFYLRYRRLPAFISKLIRLFFKDSGNSSGNDSRQSHSRNGSAAKDPYEILGITPDATQEEIHAAYRAAAQQYHPDKVAHLGEEFKELAQKKFVEIQDAYNILMQKHS